MCSATMSIRKKNVLQFFYENVPVTYESADVLNTGLLRIKTNISEPIWGKFDKV